MGKNYGMPYKGSKNSIAKWVLENLPPAETLYDLFGGGRCYKSYSFREW